MHNRILPLTETAQAGTPLPAATAPEDAPSSPQLGAEGPALPRPALPETHYSAAVQWEFDSQDEPAEILERIEELLAKLPGSARLKGLGHNGVPVTPQSPLAMRREAGRFRYLPRRD